MVGKIIEKFLWGKKSGSWAKKYRLPKKRSSKIYGISIVWKILEGMVDLRFAPGDRHPSYATVNNIVDIKEPMDCAETNETIIIIIVS